MSANYKPLGPGRCELNASRGFDAFVGNPPFLGGTRISVANGTVYRDWLATTYQSSSLTDLVAYFFRRTFDLLRHDGTAGLLATNSIAQGDTRTTGLSWICLHGGAIYSATRRMRWPGLAAVVVSVVHFVKGRAQSATLDGRSVPRVSAYLFHKGGDESPAALAANRGVSVIGSFVLGIGFVFEDGNPGATPLSEMNRLFVKDARNKERVFAFLGGEELNASPTQTAHRYIIDFGDMTEAEARQWPDLMSIVEAKVKKARASVTQRDRRELWWLHATRSPEMRSYVASHGRCLALSQVSTHLALAWIGPGVVMPHTNVMILMNTDASLAILQSRVHAAWAKFLGSSFKDDARYTPTDCFETFPFSANHEHDPTLEAIGKSYYDFRASLMVTNSEGLTKTYNRFHDPEERAPDILKLRDLHDQMDRAVLDAYGWADIKPSYDFRGQLDESIRRTWSEDTRDDVLVRLLELNRVRAELETKSAPMAKVMTDSGKKKAKKREASGTLFGDDE